MSPDGENEPGLWGSSSRRGSGWLEGKFPVLRGLHKPRPTAGVARDIQGALEPGHPLGSVLSGTLTLSEPQEPPGWCQSSCNPAFLPPLGKALLPWAGGGEQEPPLLAKVLSQASPSLSLH